MTELIESLQNSGRKLALRHVVSKKSGRLQSFLKLFEEDMSVIRQVAISLQMKSGGCEQAAENWLLDNLEFIEEQAFEVKMHLDKAVFEKLPLLKTGHLRITTLLDHYIETVEGKLNNETLIAFLNAYQEVIGLLIAEIRVVPLLLRVTLIHRFAQIMKEVRYRKQICHQVTKFVSSLPAENLNMAGVNVALNNIEKNTELSGAWIVHLISHLREVASDVDDVNDWLSSRFETSVELSRIIKYENSLQKGFQLQAGNLITSLRQNERSYWEESFKQISQVEQAFNNEGSRIYCKMDTESKAQLLTEVERIAKRFAVAEIFVARKAVQLAEQAMYNKNVNEEQYHAVPARATFLAYYLFDKFGIKELIERLKETSNPKKRYFGNLIPSSITSYFGYLLGFFIIFSVMFTLWLYNGKYHSPLEWCVIIFGALFLSSEWVVVWLHTMIEFFSRPKPLLRYDFSSGIPKEARTIVTIPIIWSTFEEVDDMIQTIELHYLSCRDENILFALLCDFIDSAKQWSISDERLLRYATRKIEELNEQYPHSTGVYFHLFQRSRQWNEKEFTFMGWERKRGKLIEFAELLRGSNSTSFIVRPEWGKEFFSVNQVDEYMSSAKYIITLDADTRLPIGNAHRMIATMHFPYNTPVLNATKTRVVDGYAVLQPRISVSLESSLRSKLSGWWTEAGLDPYSYAAADPYQDTLGQGIFTGKGIFDIELFLEVLGERIPDNQILSHDLLEGSLLRTGFLSDIELIDDHPNRFSTYQKRMHRWVRGDWQLFPWLFGKTLNRRGKMEKVDLSAINRWQIFENMRRSLTPIVMYLLLLYSVTIFSGNVDVWLTLIVTTYFLPLIRQTVIMAKGEWKGKSLLNTFMQTLISFWVLPFQVAVLMHAIAISLYRKIITKNHLLEWVSSSHLEKLHHKSAQPVLEGMGGGYLLIACFGVLAVQHGKWSVTPLYLLICLFWALAPFGIRSLDKEIALKKVNILKSDRKILIKLAKDIWRYYDEFADETNNWLPPDNVQIDPPKGVAHRTSPTNIGYLLMSILVAKKMDFIDVETLLTRMNAVFDSVDKLEKWQGHLYNWYDTKTLMPLMPRYVSTVDSGNYIASLIAVKQGILQVACEIVREHEYNQLLALSKRIELLIKEPDFSALYNSQAKLFSLGYNLDLGRCDNVLYDLLASEARLASFVAIALGQAPVNHWMTLGRASKKQGKHMALISWSGTMFEYLMPWQLLRTYPNTVWDSTYKGIVARQIEYAHARKIPFGISESGYYGFDFQMNYQYYAFGVPQTGFKRGLEEELVLAPYATLMALPYAPETSLRDLGRMDRLGARGKYGFYEAIDYTTKRLPAGQKYMIVKSFMAHHQGMGLLAIANVLHDNFMINNFHADRRVQTAELLLQEKIPTKDAIIHERIGGKIGKNEKKENYTYKRHFDYRSHKTEVNIHANTDLTSLITSKGGGLLKYKNLAVTRWREKSIDQNWGSKIYIRDQETGQISSLMEQADFTLGNSGKYCVNNLKGDFLLGHSKFYSKQVGIETTVEICVAPTVNAELRKIKMQNVGKKVLKLECTTFIELSLAEQNADEAHPAFCKLFVETEYDALTECLIARKRSRNPKEQDIWCYHNLVEIKCNNEVQKLYKNAQRKKPVQFETDRNSFVGRIRLLNYPQGIERDLIPSVGAVTDPIFAMRRIITINPGETKTLLCLTGVTEKKEEISKVINNYRCENKVDELFRLAFMRVQTELRHFQITQQEATLFQQLVGRLLYNVDISEERKNAILENKLSQKDLWSLGISGEHPLVIVRISDLANLSFVQKLIIGHAYLRNNGFNFSLVLFNESNEGYQQDVHETLQRLAESEVFGGQSLSGKIHIISENKLELKMKSLLFAVARIILQADGAGLVAQMGLPEANNTSQEKSRTKETRDKKEKFGSNELVFAGSQNKLFFNGLGGFSELGHEYTILLEEGRSLRLPWINVMANANFGTLVSEKFTGYTWWKNSREFKLTPWSNDPVSDVSGECCYIRDDDSGEFWRLASSITPCRITHGQGYSKFLQKNQDIACKTTVFVAKDDPIKVIKIQVKNSSKYIRNVSLFYYVQWVLGVKPLGNMPFIVTRWHENEAFLSAKNHYSDNFRGAQAFLFAVDGVTSWTGDDFVGDSESIDYPKALKNKVLDKKCGVSNESCGAIQKSLTLEAGKTETIYFLVGCEKSENEVVQLVSKYNSAQSCEDEFIKQQQNWRKLLTQIQVSTPNAEMDCMLNNWLLYQTLSCRLWGRSAFYQAGGAYGFRDQLQDAIALLHAAPDFLRRQIILHASHQYVEGDVQHWWHEETGVGIRTRFSDDLHWLPYAVLRYLLHTDDKSLLQEEVHYLMSQPLRDDEHERYEPTVVSGEKGTIYDHCVRALNRGLAVGEHGLPLIGIGDWNDGMSHIGAKGRGESVWLGWFFGSILEPFAKICDEHGDYELATRYRKAKVFLAHNLNTCAWDGAWYRRAFCDDGSWIGTSENKECRIDAIAQSWAVLSGLGDEDKICQAMDSFDRELVDRNLEIIKLLAPAFDATVPSPGYIQGYPPGIRENGGQYSHGVVWSILAWVNLRNGNKAAELFDYLNPINHTKSLEDVQVYGGEPYVMAADVYSAFAHEGQAGWTWYTGASGWMYQAGIEGILGLKKRGDFLYIKPCIPEDWPGFTLTYRFNESEYHFIVKNSGANLVNEIKKVSFDGKELDQKNFDNDLGVKIALVNDKLRHEIIVIL